MSLPLKLDFSNYDNFLTEPNYTTSAEAQDYFRNMDMLVEALIDVGLWQPETNYPNGHVVFSPNMPNGTEAVCVATNGGKSSNAEPSWGEVGGYNVSDGTCFWKLRWKHWSKDVASVDDMKNGTSNDKLVTPKLARLGQTATNRLPNTAYSKGNVVYVDSNLSVALKCTTAGTTSNTELDVSGNNVGESVEDGSVVWEVVSRDTVATIDKERPIKTFTSLEQIGLDNNASEEDIALALPLNSMLIMNVVQTSYPNLNIGYDGILVVQKPSGLGYVKYSFNNMDATLTGNYSNWSTKKFSGWKKLAKQGKLSMPSDKFISIAFNFTNENTSWQSIEYTAPCDGWAAIYCSSGATNFRSIVTLRTPEGLGVTDIQYGTYGDRCLFLPVKKGSKVEFKAVNCSFNNNVFFRFYYAQSEV